MVTETESKVSSYLSFKIGEEEYAANVDAVQNILEVQEITRLPVAPAFLKGVINLRGRVLPVVDTRVKFRMTPTEFTENTCIMVMDLKIDNRIIHMGALIDSVEAVHNISEDSIVPPSDVGTSFISDFITGIAKVNDRFIMILDLIKLFTELEINQLEINNN